MKNKILAILFTITIMLNFTIFSYANETTNSISSNDLNIIDKIYNSNLKILDWDIENPLLIENTKWELKDNTYYLVELDLSNTGIEGKIDLSNCNYINYYSFSNTNIKDIILPTHLNSIPQNAFEGCIKLEYVNVPKNINSISSSAFKNCSNLKSVVFNNNNTTILSYAFSGCVSLECIINANNIISIGRNAFTNCSNLIFYDENLENSYIKNYAQTMNYQFSSNTVSNVTGYISIMTSSNEQNSKHYPYMMGTAYLYDENNVLLETNKLDKDGKFSFDKLSIGYKYKIVIDGQFAIARSKYFVASKKNNDISDKENPIPVVTCDFNNDGVITVADTGIIYKKAGSRDEEDVLLYDLNGDSFVTSADAIVIYALSGFSYSE